MVFYTAPGVKNIDPDVDRSFVETICAADAAFVVTRLADVDTLAALAKQMVQNPLFDVEQVG